MPGGEPVLVQHLLEIFVLDVLVAVERELENRWTLEHDDHQRIAVAPKLEVLEETRLEQGARRFAQPPLVDGVADVDRQVVVDGAFGDALIAFYPEIAHDERLHRRPRIRADPACGSEQSQTRHANYLHEPNNLTMSL